MAAAKAKAKSPAKTARSGKTRAARRIRGQLAPGRSVRGLDASQVAIGLDSEEIAEVVALVRSAGGAPIGAYRDPLGGRHWCWHPCR